MSLVLAHGGDLGGFHHWDSGWGLVMMLGMVLFWAAVIGLIVWLVIAARRTGPPAREASSLEVLDRRFAEGSISEDEYAERRRVLEEAAASRRHGAP